MDPHMKSVLTYSREGYTCLYSKILSMFKLIRTGDFDPDMSAIDRVVQFLSMHLVMLWQNSQGHFMQVMPPQTQNPVWRQSVVKLVMRVFVSCHLIKCR